MRVFSRGNDRLVHNSDTASHAALGQLQKFEDAVYRRTVRDVDDKVDAYNISA